MTTPDPGETERRFAALWKFARSLEDEITELKTWRATERAVSVWRRYAMPLAISVLGLILTLVNVLVLIIHH